ncbi:MAG: class I SAM-dependent methyltransferase [Hyphomonadaceae bacterium]
MLAAHWQDYWANGGRGDLAIGAFEQRKFLAAHWRATFSARLLPSSALILDIASGDGAALSIAAECLEQIGRRARLLTSDAAPAAVRSAVNNVPGALGLAADAARLPLADDAASLVVSQFGIEYAGLGAFAEAARVLARDGVFSAICHIKDGVIDRECAENARLLTLMRDYDLLPSGAAAFGDFYRKGFACGEVEQRFRIAVQEFIGVLLAAPDSAAKRFLTQIMHDVSHMSARRSAYEPADAGAWFARTGDALSLYLQRMQSMRQAAMDSERIGAVAEVFYTAGFNLFEARAVAFSDGGEMAAWRIEAETPRTPIWNADAGARALSALSV